MPRPVSIVTVSHDTFFFVRLLVEKVREFVGGRPYEIIVVDRGSKDGTREWLGGQSDVRLLTEKPNRRRHHTHGEAAERGAKYARYDHVVLLDSDAHPMHRDWLELTVERLDDRHRLVGGVFHGNHRSNSRGWYIHPHFMAFQKADLGRRLTLRKIPGEDLDTGEAATVRLLDGGYEVIGHPIEFCSQFDVGHPRFPTITAGVFHAWYGTRLLKETGSVSKETADAVTRANYLEPLQAGLRRAYDLAY